MFSNVMSEVRKSKGSVHFEDKSLKTLSSIQFVSELNMIPKVMTMSLSYNDHYQHLNNSNAEYKVKF